MCQNGDEGAGDDKVVEIVRGVALDVNNAFNEWVLLVDLVLVVGSHEIAAHT